MANGDMCQCTSLNVIAKHGWLWLGEISLQIENRISINFIYCVINFFCCIYKLCLSFRFSNVLLLILIFVQTWFTKYELLTVSCQLTDTTKLQHRHVPINISNKYMYMNVYCYVIQMKQTPNFQIGSLEYGHGYNGRSMISV